MYSILDIETTGGNYDEEGITEIAIHKFDGHRVVDQFISLVKDSSLLGIIAIRELTKATREVITTTLSPFELFFTLALLYLIITFALSMFVQYLERRASTA